MSPTAIACKTCGQVHAREPLRPGTAAHCTRCGSVIERRTHHSLHRTAAFSLAALLLYWPANAFPILRMNFYGMESTNTVWEGCVRLYRDQDYLIAFVVFVASILVPLLKLIGLFSLSITSKLHFTRGRVQRTWVYVIIEAIGRWAMLDVFVLAILVSLVKLQKLATVVAGPGLLAFTLVVICTILASASFDPQLIWEKEESASLSQSSDKKSHEPADLPKPIVRRMRWPFPLIWIVPLLAAGLAGYYVYLDRQQRGPLIEIKFDDVSGIQSGQTPIRHLGVEIGVVESIGLTPDNHQALLHVRLHRPAEQFARQGAQFWIVRPQISFAAVSGLNTVISGPYIEATPGQGDRASEFPGLPSAPIAGAPGLHVTLYGEHPEHLDVNAPVSFRGIEVGQIEGISLTADSRRVAVRAFIYNRYGPLVRPDSKFWIVSGADVKGGLFTGVEVKLDSVRSLITGGVAFASPNDKQGQPTSGPAADGTEFELNDEPKKEWLSWSPRIPLAPE